MELSKILGTGFGGYNGLPKLSAPSKGVFKMWKNVFDSVKLILKKLKLILFH